MRRIAIGLSITIALACAQTNNPHPPFEVASIKPNLSGDTRYTITPSPGGLTATNIPLSYLIMSAFRINDYQLVGAPAWASDRYDIAAKPGAATPEDRQQMLRSLLEDRFRLRIHRETRERSEYALTIAKGGSKLSEPKEAICPQEPAETTTPCGRLSWATNNLGGRRAPMQMLVFVLSQSLATTVVDETGLKGPYDMSLRWASDPSDSTNPSLPAALEEKLGLKLIPRKGPVEVIVVDHVERPGEN